MAYEEIINSAAKEFGLDPELIKAVMGQESGGRSEAVSPKGARGLMQLMPATAQSLGVKNIFDPAENIRAGARYLRQQLDRFGDVSHALAAYNAGPEAVARYGGIPPYRETQGYVKSILGRLGQGRGVEAKVASPKTEPPQATPERNPFEERIKAFGMGYDVAAEPYYQQLRRVSPPPSRNQKLLEVLPAIMSFAQMFQR